MMNFINRKLFFGQNNIPFRPLFIIIYYNIKNGLLIVRHFFYKDIILLDRYFFTRNMKSFRKITYLYDMVNQIIKYKITNY